MKKFIPSLTPFIEIVFVVAALTAFCWAVFGMFNQTYGQEVHPRLVEWKDAMESGSYGLVWEMGDDYAREGLSKEHFVAKWEERVLQQKLALHDQFDEIFSFEAEVAFIELSKEVPDNWLINYAETYRSANVIVRIVTPAGVMVRHDGRVLVKWGSQYQEVGIRDDRGAM